MTLSAMKNLLVTVLVALGFRSFACQCPSTSLSLEECNRYEIIFRGKILSVQPCGNKFGEAVFEISELYKGNSTQQFKVLFECTGECYMQFLPGDEWIIYSNFKQVNNAMMNWCSRSRKLFNNLQEDFYTVNYGNDYDDELKFLRENLGLHRFLTDTERKDVDRNKIPDITQTIILVICSLLAIILFYWLINKFLRF